jgi:hypothetical protein
VGSVTSSAEWSAFVAKLAAEADQPRVAATRVADLPTYQDIPFPELLAGIQRTFRAGLKGLLQRRHPGPEEDLSGYEAAGEQRARQGVSLADLILCWTTGLEVAHAGAFRCAPEGEHREAMLLEAVELMTAWNMLGMNAQIAAHRRGRAAAGPPGAA